MDGRRVHVNENINKKILYNNNNTNNNNNNNNNTKCILFY